MGPWTQVHGPIHVVVTRLGSALPVEARSLVVDMAFIPTTVQIAGSNVGCLHMRHVLAASVGEPDLGQPPRALVVTRRPARRHSRQGCACLTDAARLDAK